MKLLLDAHTFLWFVWDEVQLTNDAKAMVETGAYCWEAVGREATSGR